MADPNFFEIDDNNGVLLEAVAGAKFLKYEIAKRRLLKDYILHYEIFEETCKEFSKYRENYKKHSSIPEEYREYTSDQQFDCELLWEFKKTESKESFCKKIDADIKIIEKVLAISEKYGYVATCLLLDRNIDIKKHYLITPLKINQDIYWKNNIKKYSSDIPHSPTDPHNSKKILYLNNHDSIGIPFPTEEGYWQGIFCNNKISYRGLDIHIPESTLRNIRKEIHFKKVLYEIEIFLRKGISFSQRKDHDPHLESLELLFQKIIEIFFEKKYCNIRKKIDKKIQEYETVLYNNDNTQKITESLRKDIAILFSEKNTQFSKEINNLLSKSINLSAKKAHCKCKEDILVLLQKNIHMLLYNDSFLTHKKAKEFRDDNLGSPLNIDIDPFYNKIAILLKMSIFVLINRETTLIPPHTKPMKTFSSLSSIDTLEKEFTHGFGNTTGINKKILSLIIWDAKTIHKKQSSNILKELNDALKKISGVSALSDIGDVSEIYNWADKCIKENSLHNLK